VTAAERRVLPDADALAAEVARALRTRLADAQARGEVPHVVLTGGTIADLLHREVARQEAAGEQPAVDWSAVEVWWGDERFVPGADGDRNAGQAAAALLDHVDVDPARVHVPPASDGGLDLDAAAAAYDDELAAAGPPTFEVVMLGVGPDGHVASLFPGHPQRTTDDRDVVAVRDSPKPPPERVSLTYRALARTREVWFLVSGDGKADAVADALGGADPARIPATGLDGLVERRTWWLDEAAASRL